jgi:N-acyl-D-aspartate/D-glutamate deacylase
VEGLQSWREALPLKGQALIGKLAEPSFREAVRLEIARPATFRLFNGEWDKVQVIEVARSGNAWMEQRTIADLATQLGRDPLDVMLDLAIEEDLATVFSAVLLNSDETAVTKILQHPASLISLSDAGAHLTFFNDAGFGLHLLGHWSRELGAIALPDAIRRLTNDSASALGLRDRGRIAIGLPADLLLFDPGQVGRGPKHRVHDLPGGGARLDTPALGVHGVWVNGSRVVGPHGISPDAPRSGRLLRGGRDF